MAGPARRQPRGTRPARPRPAKPPRHPAVQNQHLAPPLPNRPPHQPGRRNPARLRVVTVGNYRPTFSTETHTALALEALGHDVDRVQEDDTTTDRLLDRARHADLLIYTRTWGLTVGTLNPCRMIDQLHDAGCVTASYHLDLYRGVQRAVTVDPTRDAFWRTRYVFTADGDPDTQTWMEARGVNHRWLPAGVCHLETTPGTPNPARWPWPVVFVGSLNYASLHPEWTYRDQLLARLTRRYRGRFAAIPNDGVPIRGRDLNDLYATARVVVGDSLCPGFTWRNYWSDRVYETVGRGGFLVMPHVPGLDAHFTDGQHLRFYNWGDFAGLCAIIDGALDDPAAARRVAAWGQAHVAANHTYLHRMRDLVQQVADAEGWT